MESVAILICTRNRTEGLRKLLDALDDQVLRSDEVTVSIVVTDNDPKGSAAVEASTQRRWPVQYQIEPTPGIPAARTAALRAGLEHDLLAFIDDDEVPATDWLQELLDARTRYAADGVAGPVAYEFAVPLSRWLAVCGFDDRPGVAEGGELQFAATGNLLLSSRAIREAGLLSFDEKLTMAGGSDTAFTSELVAAGRRLVWTERALVTESVPASRANLRWVLGRAFRTGNGIGNSSLKPSSRPARRVAVALQGVLRAGSGAFLVMVSIARRDQTGIGKGVRRLIRGAGVLCAAGGYTYREYSSHVRTT